ncbi:MAG: beta-propeller domain-containing protein [Myxococcales bacterium]|nr:beta-propeller domain-containing protein [Myxococcales bacterium]
MPTKPLSFRSLPVLFALAGCSAANQGAGRATSATNIASVDAGALALAASDSGVAVTSVVARADAAVIPAPNAVVIPRAVVRAATEQDAWSTAGSVTALGSRAALSAHLRRAAQQRIAAMSAEERAEALEYHRERMRPRPRGVRYRSGGLSAAGVGQGFGAASVAPRSAPSNSAAPSSSSSSASITNNQVANVDEGDIVKASGDDLIILRRGHLFRVSLANNSVRTVGHTPAFPPNTRPGDWYDELLVDGDIALVLGYSYRANATEVNRFRLERNGSIRYLDSFYVRSDDYYSSENYATRLVDGRFVVYVPMTLAHEDPWETRFRLPTVRVGRSGAFREPFDYSHVFVSDANRGATTLHTVLQCDIRGARVACNAQGVLGGSSRTFYVSGTAVYVWTEPDDNDSDRGQQRQTGSWIVRLPLSQRATPGAARVRGGPVDQFAFDERGGSLHMLLRNDGHGDAMWSSQTTAGAVAALKIPLARLSGSVSDAPASAYTMLVEMQRGGAFKERWIGEYALFGSGRRAYGPGAIQPGMSSQLFAYRASDQRLFELQTEQGIERIEPLGAHALAVGNAGDTLVLTPIALDGATPTTFAPLRLRGRAQGETRSHGFFFRPSAARDGVFGIATSGNMHTGRRQLSSASDLSFFRVESLALSPLGTLESRTTSDRCSVSCADWYGNTRPIFWRDRVLALMGDEVVEATLSARSLTERARVDFGAGVRTVEADEDEDDDDEE